MSHFFAYLAKMKYINRWGLMRNTRPENIQEHSLQVAMIAHGLATIKNKLFGGTIDPERIAVLALFHDVGEVITGDLATPIKYLNPKIKAAYGEIDVVAKEKLLEMLPDVLRDAYRPLLFPKESEREHLQLLKAADRICAYLKCLEEKRAGNREFSKAEIAIQKTIEKLDLPEVDYFMRTFVPSFSLTLDELN